MTTSPATGGTPDVPTQVFREFLQALGGAGVPADSIARLRKTLLEDGTFTENALKAAVLGEEPVS